MITIDEIINTIKSLYPETIRNVENNKYYDYLNLFGVRVKTCDTSNSDDIIGGFWLSYSLLGDFPNYDSIIVNASLDPSPYYIANPVDPRGTAWVKEGQHLFTLSSYKGEPAFRPKGAVPVYRMPKGQTLDVRTAANSTSVDTLIHRSWGTKLYKDSAGCQVVPLKDIKRLTDRAKIHIKKYPKLKSQTGETLFTYTLLTQEQIDKYGSGGSLGVKSNTGFKFPSIPSLPSIQDFFKNQ